jgi:hypothetical protein
MRSAGEEEALMSRILQTRKLATVQSVVQRAWPPSEKRIVQVDHLGKV